MSGVAKREMATIESVSIEWADVDVDHESVVVVREKCPRAYIHMINNIKLKPCGTLRFVTNLLKLYPLHQVLYYLNKTHKFFFIFLFFILHVGKKIKEKNDECELELIIFVPKKKLNQLESHLIK